MAQNSNHQIFETGWEVFDSLNFENLKQLRQSIYKIVAEEFNLDEQEPEIDEVLLPEVVHPTLEDDYESLKSAVPEYAPQTFLDNLEEFKENGYNIPPTD